MCRSNPFRVPALRKQYDLLVQAHASGHNSLAKRADGSSPGNSLAAMFWRGYDGVEGGLARFDRASKETFAYAAWCAGRDVRKCELKT